MIDITNNYVDFKSLFKKIDYGDWVLLMQCLECDQLWKIDEWDKYQTLYAFKISSKQNWKKFDSQSLVENKIMKNRGGLESSICKMVNCKNFQVKGSAFCTKHLYETGTRH